MASETYSDEVASTAQPQRCLDCAYATAINHDLLQYTTCWWIGASWKALPPRYPGYRLGRGIASADASWEMKSITGRRRD